MMLLYNARVYTLDPSRPFASALVVEGGRVTFVGDDELVNQVDREVKKLNMAGQVLLPGLIDSHFHLQTYALGLRKVNCEINSYALCLERIRERVGITQSGNWILGHGWNQNIWKDSPSSEDRCVPGYGNAADLDAISSGRPVYLTAKSLHAGWANSAALDLAGITSETPDPPKGRLQRDRDGRLTGILFESAMQLVERVIPQPGELEAAEAIKEAQKTLWPLGLTGVHDFDHQMCFRALQYLHSRKELGLRVVKSVPLENLSHAAALGLHTGFGDDYLRIGPVKVFMDGALGPCTAAMIDSYEHESGNYGILNINASELFDIGCQAAESGLSLAVHAIGDRANREALDAIEKLRSFEKQKGLPALRHRIEHVQLIHLDDVGRLGVLDVIASMQPTHVISDMAMADEFWGKRASLSYAWRSQLEHGASLAFGSDAPVELPDPFLGIYAAVNRQDKDDCSVRWYSEQCLSVEEAIHGFTAGAAYAAGMEGSLGCIKPGYLADLIVLDTDPFSCDPSSLHKIRASAVMISGEWVLNP
ncbi:MAG: amidohydrolase [Anaerolineales bacterium]|nr:amidohydrolase [Anaerolineales bacterium]